MAFGDDDILSIPFRYVVYIVAGLPTTALALCIAIAVFVHFEDATSTHCMVINWLPSVSAAVSSFTPEKYIWRVLVGLHGAPRFFLAIAFRNFLLSSPLQPSGERTKFRCAANFTFAINCIEVLALLLLTAIGSTENHGYHKVAFGVFVGCSLMYMAMSTALYDYSGRRRSFKQGDASFEYKCLAMLIFCVSLIGAAYFYWRHNRYCEAGMYSAFAFCEYVVILSNIAFHSTLYFDFRGKAITLGSANNYGGYLPLTNLDKDT